MGHNVCDIVVLCIGAALVYCMANIVINVLTYMRWSGRMQDAGCFINTKIERDNEGALELVTYVEKAGTYTDLQLQAEIIQQGYYILKLNSEHKVCWARFRNESGSSFSIPRGCRGVKEILRYGESECEWE